MEYILIQKKDFQARLLEDLKTLEALSSEKLVEHYNRQAQIGIVGVYAQAIYLAAMRKVFIDRFNQSPIELQENIVLRLHQKIKLDKGQLKYLDGKTLDLVHL